MSVLVTGFGAFGDQPDNPSGRIARGLDGASLAGHRIRGLVLPVATDRVEELLERALADVRPDVLLVLGVAPGRPAPALERVAVNVRDFPIPDIDGRQPVDSPIVTDGPTAYLTGLPIKAILRNWSRDDIPGYVSNTAGTYVCNQSFYLARHLTVGTSCRSGLIHLPAAPSAVEVDAHPANESVATVDLATSDRAVRDAIRTCLQHRGDDVSLGAGALS